MPSLAIILVLPPPRKSGPVLAPSAICIHSLIISTRHVAPLALLAVSRQAYFRDQTHDLQTRPTDRRHCWPTLFTARHSLSGSASKLLIGLIGLCCLTQLRSQTSLATSGQVASLRAGLTLVIYWAGHRGSAAAGGVAGETQQLSYVPMIDASPICGCNVAAVIQ